MKTSDIGSNMQRVHLNQLLWGNAACDLFILNTPAMLQKTKSSNNFLANFHTYSGDLLYVLYIYTWLC
jgi:hypothetical protein